MRYVYRLLPCPPLRMYEGRGTLFEGDDSHSKDKKYQLDSIRSLQREPQPTEKT